MPPIKSPRAGRSNLFEDCSGLGTSLSISRFSVSGMHMPSPLMTSLFEGRILPRTRGHTVIPTAICYCMKLSEEQQKLHPTGSRFAAERCHYRRKLDQPTTTGEIVKQVEGRKLLPDGSRCEGKRDYKASEPYSSQNFKRRIK